MSKITQLVGLQPGTYIFLFHPSDINTKDLEETVDSLPEGVEVFAIPSYDPSRARFLVAEKAEIIKVEGPNK